jgi:hypothetical protein
MKPPNNEIPTAKPTSAKIERRVNARIMPNYELY